MEGFEFGGSLGGVARSVVSYVTRPIIPRDNLPEGSQTLNLGTLDWPLAGVSAYISGVLLLLLLLLLLLF